MILKLLKKYKAQLGDSIWIFMGLVLMNAVAQIAVYPMLNRLYGVEGYGEIQYLMAYINIIAISVGGAANLARMTAPKDERLENNGDYQLFLLTVSAVGIPLTLLLRAFGGVAMDTPTTICFYLLFVAMTFRYYVDVSYKMTLRYRRYFFQFLVIGVGYVVGIFLTQATRIWPLCLLCGEMAGVLFAFLSDGTLRRKMLRPSGRMGWVWRCVLLLCLSEGISNLIANVDRLLLKFFVGASAVTVYYLATLVGKTMSFVVGPLNSVLIGYLTRYEGNLTKRMMKWIMLGAFAAVVLGTGVCALGGYLALLLLYPDQVASVAPFLFVGSLAQVFSFVSSIFMVVLIRFAPKRYQVYINGIYGISFFGIGIPATIFGGVWGFAIAMVGVSGLRFVLSLVFGWVRAGRSDAVLTAQETADDHS